MKLGWQLLILIILLLITQLLGLTYLNIVNTKISTQEQLTANAQNTADSLGFSLKQHMQDNNLPMLNTATRAVFDHGYYQRIAVTNNQGERLVEFSRLNQHIDQVPNWFSRLITLTPPTATANLMRGWQVLGKIEVTTSTDYMYIAQWRSLSRAFVWLVLVTVALSIFLLIFLHFILQPIYRTKAQAEGIMLGDFPIQTKIPFTREFKTVVTTMNNMVRRLRIIFERHAQLSEHLRQQAYQDELTGFSNMRYFNIRMDFLLSMRDEFIYGTFMLVDIITDDNPRRINAIRQLSALIKANLDKTFGAFGARLDTDTVIIMQPFINQQQAEDFCKNWLEKIKAQYQDKIQMNIGIVGLAGYWQHENLDDLLIQGQALLNHARTKGNYQIAAAMLPNHDASIDMPSLVHQAIDQKSITLIAQPVEAFEADKPLHIESRLTMPTDNINIVTTRGLTAVATYLNRAIEFDKLVLDRLLNLNTNTKQQHSHTLSRQAITHPDFLSWLEQLFIKTPDESLRLCLQVYEFVAIKEPEACQALAKILNKHKVPFGLMRVGRDFGNFDHFRTLPLDFIKINGTYTRHLEKHPENQAFIRELVYICHSLDITVIAGAVSTDLELNILENLGVDGYIMRAEGV